MGPTANDPVNAVRAADLKNSLRRYASSRLPEAMVPAHFVILPELPRLPNGKVDRKRLPAVGDADRAQARYVPPGTPVQRRIAEIWSDLLGLPKIGIEDNFFAIGGDSLSAVQMVAKVREEFGRPISLRGLFERPTIAELAAGVTDGNDRQVTRVGDVRSVRPEILLTDAELPADVVPEPDALAPADPPYESVLLTGATGFVGAFLLSELLERSDAVVHVLVRVDDGVDGAARRARENLAHYGLWRDEYGKRIVGVPADLGRPYFGMSPSAYRRLAGDVEMIVHNGSWSSFVLPYHQLKPVNVFGTMEILRLACRTRVKPVHYVSSLAALPGHLDIKEFYETRLDSPDGVLGGYPQTKWVAERMVSSAADRGLPVAVYRPGQITGAQRSGAAPPELFVCAMMKSCIQLGMAPNPNMMVEMVPVDYVSAAIIRVALDGRPNGDVYQLPSPKPVH
jgi:thioester reductase-like protein